MPTLVEIPPLSFICCGDRALVGAGLDDKVYQMNNQGDVEEVILRREERNNSVHTADIIFVSHRRSKAFLT